MSVKRKNNKTKKENKAGLYMLSVWILFFFLFSLHSFCLHDSTRYARNSSYCRGNKGNEERKKSTSHSFAIFSARQRYSSKKHFPSTVRRAAAKAVRVTTTAHSGQNGRDILKEIVLL